MALCLKSSAVRDVPHEISVEITVKKHKKAINPMCTSKAGAGQRCKHIAAVL